MEDVPDVRADRRARLKRLQDRYQALNLRSRSVRLYRTSASGALDLYQMRELRPRAFRKFLDCLGTESRKPIPIIRIQPVEEDARRFATALGMIARKARDTKMETGAHELAVGWPFLEGRCDDGIWIRGPLFLYPVTISTTTVGRVRWTVTFEGLPDCNETLLQVLGTSMDRRLELPDFLEADEDGLFKIDEETWGSFSRLLRDNGLLLANDDDRLPDLEPVVPRQREDRESAPVGSFTLHNHLVLGRFPKWGSTIVRDYEALIASDLSDSTLGPAAELLLVDENTPWEDKDIAEAVGEWEASPRDGGGRSFWDTGGEDEEAARSREDVLTRFRQWQILPSDASQDAVFACLDREDSPGLVVQGPPGTGKSQLITNLVAAAIGSGKTVLVACQKRAALDVVAERLQVQGLGEPIAVVHDVERDRGPVCNSVAQTLARVLARSADPRAFEDTLSAAQAKHDQALRRLQSRLALAHDAYRALTERTGGRPSLAALQERALEDDGRPLPDLLDVAGHLPEAQFEEVLPRLEAVCVESQRFAAPHPLSARRRWHGLTQEELEAVFDAMDRLADIGRELEAAPGAMTPVEAAAQESVWSRAASLLDLLEAGPEEDRNRFRFFWVWTGGDLRHGEWERVMSLLSAARHQLAPVPPDMVCASRDKVEAEAGSLARLQHLQASWYRVFLPEWWRLRKLPETMVAEYGVPEDQRQDAAGLEALCREALKWMDLIAELPLDMPFMDIGLQGDPKDVARLTDSLTRWHDLVESVHVLYQDLSPRGGPYAQWPDIADVSHPLSEAPLFDAAIGDRRRASLWRRFEHELEALAPAFPTAFTGDLRERAQKARWRLVLSRLDALREVRGEVAGAAEVDRLLRDLPDWAWTFLLKWRSRRAGSREGVAADARTAVERAWRTTLLAGRHPHVLEAPLVDSEHLRLLSRELKAMREVAARGVLARYLRRIVKTATHPGRNRALRRLAAEVGKRRRRMTLRQLVERFWDTGLRQVRPAWFCSPESIAALFPLTTGLFDLVIFDEASQCPVESGLPALVRARRVVIAGDDQQMPPSHFFRTSLEEDAGEDDEMVLASRSILNLARVALDATTLRWHYRSMHEELVAFSNAAFYGGRLITAPHAGGVERPFEGLHWIQVDGFWKEQVNEVEADQVVNLLGELLAPSDGGDPPSVGVVTFNRKQAALIESLIDLRADKDQAFQAALARDRSRPLVDQLFVRNLENVQGDERDVIVFSTGYGPAEPGGRVHARFGPLGQEGGEKRLNVAVTRARKGVWVIVSFDPSSLDVSSARRAGPKLFRLYLEFVKQVAERRGAPDALLAEAGSLGQAKGITAKTTARWEAAEGPGGVVAAQLAQTLGHQGYRVQENIGLGGLKLDLAVGMPGHDRWCLGIDCRRFLRVKDDLDRDVYTPGFWKRMGWRVERVSPATWLERRDRILATITAACPERTDDPLPRNGA